MDQLVLNRRRQEMLHKRWSENVYDPIRCAVEREMNSCRFLEFQERKKQLYKEYIEYVNRKVSAEAIKCHLCHSSANMTQLFIFMITGLNCYLPFSKVISSQDESFHHALRAMQV